MSASCDSSALVWGEKDPDDAETFFVDFESWCSRIWSRETDFAAAVRIRSGGYDLVSSGGRSGKRPPSLPTTIGGTVVDGSIVWTCAALSASSLVRTISGTPTWTADSGISIASEGLIGLTASAIVSSGTDGNDYQILVKATGSDGTSKTAACVLPVRRPHRTCEC